MVLVVSPVVMPPATGCQNDAKRFIDSVGSTAPHKAGINQSAERLNV